MRLTFSALLLYFLLLPGALSASNIRLQTLNYSVYIAGLRSLNINLYNSLGNKDYGINIVLNTEGLADKLFKWGMTAFSYGKLKQSTVLPRKAGRSSIWRGKQRSVRLEFSGNSFPTVEIISRNKDITRNLLPLEKLMGARDLAGSILSYLMFAGNTNACIKSERVFDGRRDYNLVFENQAKVKLRRNKYSPYDGPALRCQFTLQKIAGFRSKASRYTWITDGSARIWLAQVFSNTIMIPVRLEADTIFGGLFVHLVAAQQSYKGEKVKLRNISNKTN